MSLETQFWRRWKRFRHAVGPSPPSVVTVFVVGMQRSGTNMLMEAFERSRETAVFHDFDGRAFDQYLLRETATIRRLTTTCGAPFVVYKALFETADLADLLADHAPARAVWIVRRPDDVVNSVVRSFGDLAPQVAKIVAGEDDGQRHGRNLGADTVATLRRCWHPHVDGHNAAALLWYSRNIGFFDRGFDHNEAVRVVRYEAVASDPTTTLHRLCDWLGMAWRPRMAGHVHARSVGRHPAPPLEPAVRDLCETLWERFERLSC